MKFSLVLKNGQFLQQDDFAYDIIIRGGTVIDPSNNRNAPGDVYIKGSRFARPGRAVSNSEGGCVIDAEGCIVVPGLIDLHTHSFGGNGEGGAPPDTLNIPCGVTSVLDAGSSGAYNFDSFYKTDIVNSTTTVKALLNVCSHGFLAYPYGENIDPAYYDTEQIFRAFEKHSAVIKGLKIRLGKALAKNYSYGIKALKETIKLADELVKAGYFCPVDVHIQDMPDDLKVADVVSLLRKGDIVCHCFSGDTQILDSAGRVIPEVIEARRRGVLFDCCGNRIAVSYDVARKSIAQGFLPDILATDITASSRYRRPCVCLPNVVSMYLALGMNLFDAVKAVTAAPAAAINSLDEIGTLSAPAPADLAVFKMMRQKTLTEDKFGTKISYDECFVPMLTIKKGRMEFRQMFFQQELS